jgi:hypothetical protein
LIILPLLSVSVNGQNMTKDDDEVYDDNDDFLIYGKSIFGLSIKYPVSTWVVEEGERNFNYSQDGFATFYYQRWCRLYSNLYSSQVRV